MAKKQERQIEHIWIAHRGPQVAFLAAKEFEVLYGGAKSGGKSDALVNCLLTPPYIHTAGYKGLLIRRTYKRLMELKDRCDRIYLKIDPGARYNKDEHRYYFSTGAIIQLGHCEHEDDKWNYWGHEHQIICIDQVEELTETQYNIIKMCARSTVKGLKPIIRCTANPGVKWVKEYWIDTGVAPGEVFTYSVKTPDGTEIEMTRRFIPATIYDNKTILEQNPEYVALLASEPNERLRRMNLYGEWDVPENAAFDEFDKKVHVKKLVELFPGSGIPSTAWTCYGTLDWGYSKPFAMHWHVITPYDKIITFREYYGILWDANARKFKRNVGIRMLGRDVAREIVNRSKDLDLQYIIADSSIFDSVGQEAGSVGLEMQLVLAEAGISMIKSIKGQGSRLSRKMQTHSRLATAPDGQPWWLIADCCQHLIRTIQELPIDENKNDQIDTDAEDHAWDGVSYGFLQFPLQVELSAHAKQLPSAMDGYRPRNQVTEVESLAATYH